MIGKGSNTNFADGVSSFSSTPGLNRTTNISKERQEEPDHPHSVVSWWSYTVWFRDVFLPLVATVNTPPYSMMSCLFLTCSLLFYCAEAVRTALVLYLVYCVADQLPKKPQKPYVVKMLQRWCNNSWFFRWTADYFPCKLHKSSCSSGVHEEEDNGPYIFAYHPHGVIGMGVNIALNTNACNFQKMFPGIIRSSVTLNVSFWVPFYRDWVLLNGFCSANKRTLVGRLKEGESLVLVPGGAKEALFAHPKTMRLALKHRTGFIRLSLETGVPLVPVLGFGENDVFDTIVAYDENSPHTHGRMGILWQWVWKLQNVFKRFFSFSIPIWTNFIPNRKPINVVVGKPIRFDKKEYDESNKSVVDEYHSLYIKSLYDLYNEQKANYGYKDVPLEII